jgi:ABC-2 type transport system permease protein
MNALRGTAALTALAVRRDRYRLSAYVLGLAGFLGATAAMIVADTDASQRETARVFAGNAAMRMLGLSSGASDGGYTMLRDYLLLAILAALMSVLAVVRHTRQNEETGRAELVGAAAVGRYAGLAAALLVTIAANVVLAVLLGMALIVNGQSVASSLVAGASVSAVGVVFAGVAAVTVQLSSTTRGASGLAAAVLGLAFVLSGVGNMLGSVDASGLRASSAWPAWLSPIGWGQQMRPFGGDNWWPLSLVTIAFVVLVSVAGVLVARRDVGRGMLAERRGHAEARPSLLSPFGLVWRLQRGAMIGWTVGMLGFGLVFGAIIGDVTDAGGATAEWYARMGGSDKIVDAYRTSIMEMAGMAVAVYTVQTLLRMRNEEADGPLEPILATAVSRSRWLLSHIFNAGLGALVLLLVFAVSMGLAAGVVLGDVAAQLRALAEAGLVQLPGIMVIAGVVVAVAALLPRWAGSISWTFVMMSIVLGPMFGGATLQLPRWMQDISPFTHIPKAPAAEVTIAPLGVLLVVSAVLAAAGLLAFRRRNLVLPV